MFLRSIKNQTFQNYVLATTTFGEKNVSTALAEEKIPHVMFSGDAGEYRFSLTQVVQNAFALVDAPEKYLLIWTTCDVVFERDFFEKIVSSLPSRASCTAIPHVLYASIEDLQKNMNRYYSWGGIDTICFDADILRLPEVKDILQTYPNKGWGLFEYFLTDIGKLFCTGGMYNLWPAKICKVGNDRNANNETRNYFDLSTTYNSMTYNDFRKKYGIKRNTGCVFWYKTRYRYAYVTIFLFLNIAKNSTINACVRSLSRYVPQNAKSSIKKAVARWLR
jgi:hypothetical protein